MNKTRIFILLALVVCASLWFVPAAWASQCAVIPPSKYLPNFILKSPPINDGFELYQGTNAVAIRNVSSDPVYLLIPHSAPETQLSPPEVSQNLPEGMVIYHKVVAGSLYQWGFNGTWYLVKKDSLIISWISPENYVIGELPPGDCGYDHGVAEGKPLPPPQNTSIKLLFKGQFIDVSIAIEYKEDQNYEYRLKNYNKIPTSEIVERFIALFVYLVVPAIVGLYILVTLMKYLVSFVNHRRGSD